MTQSTPAAYLSAALQVAVEGADAMSRGRSNSASWDAVNVADVAWMGKAGRVSEFLQNQGNRGKFIFLSSGNMMQQFNLQATALALLVRPSQILLMRSEFFFEISC